MSRRLTAVLLALCLTLSAVVTAVAAPVNADSRLLTGREQTDEETPDLSPDLSELTARILETIRLEQKAMTETAAKAAVNAAVLVKYDGVQITAEQVELLRLDTADDDEGTVIGTLAAGKVARLLDLQGDRYLVEFDGQTGYLNTQDVRPVQYDDYDITATSNILEDVVAYACTYLGTRYVFGGSSYRGIDCSGFTMRVFGHFGYDLPHAVTGQYALCRRVSDSERRPGDLVFFDTTGGLSHVGIYLGGGRFIHAGSITGVAIRSLSEPYFARCYLFCGRLIGK